MSSRRRSNSWQHTGDEIADSIVARFLESRALDVTAYHLSEAGVKAVAHVLSQSTTVEAACLAGNDIGDNLAPVLASGIRSNRSCRSYYLNRNGFTGAGVKHIAEAMHFNDNITRINLAFNRIGKDGAAALKKLVCAQKNITQLILDDCELDEEAFAELEELVTSRGKHGLGSFSIWHNPMASETRQRWQQALQGHDTLVNVDLPEAMVNQALAKPERSGEEKIDRQDFPLG